MKAFTTLASIALCSATAISSVRADCHDLMLNIPVNGTNYRLDILRVDSNTDAIDLVVDIDRWTSQNITERILGEVNISATFSIYAQLCFPEAAKDKHIVQILSHGGVFDHRYWDSQLDPAQYSYVYAALNAGYTVLNYDRLGNGLSEKPDAYTVAQAPIEVEVLQVLTEMVRKGTLLSHSAAGYYYSPKLRLPAFDKIVHVAHSLGSQITAAFLTKYGNQSSGAILTGFTFPTKTGPFKASAFGLEFAATNNPELFGDLPSGYVVPATVNNLQNCFFHRYNASDPTGFTEEALAYAESIKQPLSVGEAVATRGLLKIGYSPDFTGPLQFYLAEFDFLVCDGDCKGDYDPSFPPHVYPNASALETYIRPGAGHGNVLHKNASAGYAVSLDFLKRHGL
ncbi:hypothetical protein LTR10_008254 [Elasticomyces elasticus]|nr:hypothetical protein LTR10_008254 [Elasticomyces elasticus]KAK4967130.1 hypothetical protein LTR42_010478 [Elasticomyces elasticus]